MTYSNAYLGQEVVDSGRGVWSSTYYLPGSADIVSSSDYALFL